LTDQKSHSDRLRSAVSQLMAGRRLGWIAAGALYAAVVLYALALLGAAMWRGEFALRPVQGAAWAGAVSQPSQDLATTEEGTSAVLLPEEDPVELPLVPELADPATPPWAELAIAVSLTPTLAVSATPAADAPLPAMILLEGVPAGRQARNLSCEVQSASDLARYYGVRCTWQDLLRRVGQDPGGNPQKGFVGNINDAPGQLYPSGYGVYAEPIARALREFGLPAAAHYDESRDWLRAQLAAGRPVVVWVTGRMMPRPVSVWRAQDGTLVRAVRYEHTVLAIGYRPEGIWVIDPWVGQRLYYPWSAFLASWDILGRMAVVVEQ
jgi:uncharacterized protein YvpB